MNWLDWDHDEELMEEFEEVLKAAASNPKNLTEEQQKCSHVWERTGDSPCTGEIWYNCSKCSVPKEET